MKSCFFLVMKRKCSTFAMKEIPSFFQFDNQAFMNMNSLIGRFFIVLSLSMSSWLGFAQEVVMMNVHQGHSVAAFESGAVDSVTFTADAHDYDKRMGELMMQHPYPITTDSLRILILGNSFSYDSTCYLQAIVDSTGIDQGRLGIYNFFIPASNFQTWIDKYESGETINVYNTVGQLKMRGEGTLQQVLSQYWDVVMIVQGSDLSYEWSSFKDTTPELLGIITSCCKNPEVRIAYQMPWGHTPAVTPKELVGNVNCAKRLAAEYGISNVVSVGIAIQNARNSSLLNDTYLLRDKWHITHGVGRYVAACTVFESLLQPVFHVSVYGNNALVKLSDEELAVEGTVRVTAENIRLCQQCALYATMYKYNVVGLE